MAFVPAPSPTVVDQTTLMKKYLQFVAALTDTNTPDETKLKMMQEVSENFENVTSSPQYSTFLEHIIPRFLTFLQDGEVQFLQEKPTQQLRKLVLEIIHRIPTNEHLRPHTKNILSVMFRFLEVFVRVPHHAYQLVSIFKKCKLSQRWVKPTQAACTQPHPTHPPLPFHLLLLPHPNHQQRLFDRPKEKEDNRDFKMTAAGLAKTPGLWSNSQHTSRKAPGGGQLSDCTHKEEKEVLSTCWVFKFHDEPSHIRIVANSFLANLSTSALFATISVEYLLERLPEMGSNVELSNLYLKLQTSLWLSVICCWRMMSELSPLSIRSWNSLMELACLLREPYNYFCFSGLLPPIMEGRDLPTRSFYPSA
ncbi:transformation/transcription domain-associated protein [Lates japonicus]|uniref:Transformation/transcription domain-associated protein n=1 Tax=Lates japonicus TaxID=270547 RepID=A0AAD3MPK3_LATJO|nr:transformation/transcription domain-associated protein [Lates japonicus]